MKKTTARGGRETGGTGEEEEEKGGQVRNSFLYRLGFFFLFLRNEGRFYVMAKMLFERKFSRRCSVNNPCYDAKRTTQP